MRNCKRKINAVEVITIETVQNDTEKQNKIKKKHRKNNSVLGGNFQYISIPYIYGIGVSDE